MLLQNPDICRKLKAELADALPEPDQVPSAAVVENLPYLKAIIQETLRLYPSAVVRQSRVAPDTDLVYANQKTGEKWVIPAGVPMMMTPMPVHLNPEYFPEPTAFNPDRWLESPHLDQYLLTFSKGTRACIGYVMVSLAYGIYFANAALGLILHTQKCLCLSREYFASMIGTTGPTSRQDQRWSYMIP